MKMNQLILALFNKKNLKKINISKLNTIATKIYIRVKWKVNKRNKKKWRDFKIIYFRAKELNLIKFRYKMDKNIKLKMLKVSDAIKILNLYYF